MFLNLPYFKFVQSLHSLYFQQEQIPNQIKDHGFSTSLASSFSPFSSSSSSFGRISFAVYREADTESLTLVVHVDPATGKADSPHRKKLRTYLGIVALDKAEFEILEASESRTKKELLQTVGERWRQFKLDLMRKWALATDQDGVDDTICEKYNISKENGPSFARLTETLLGRMCEKRHRRSINRTLPLTFCLVGKLLAEKTQKKLEDAAQSGSVDGVIDPPSPVKRHVMWKMARTKKTWKMTTEATKEITEKIDSFDKQATQGSFVPHGRRMFSSLLLDVQSTLDVSVLLELVSPSSNTSNWLHGCPAALPPCLLKNCSS
ncbi:hypothetical protein GmHk_12G035004 [Glycine max]|nr:hypothetical protein GmHk_12G035004 [Glycine max]